MTSDEALRADVISELHAEPGPGTSRIYVRARNGAVTLSGQVGSFAERRRADVAVTRVAGVKAFDTQLSIKRA